MDNKMIELVAQALKNAGLNCVDIKNHYPQELAIAAIKAMREPTSKMLDAADGEWCDDDRPELKREYQMMIDSIFND